MTKVLVLTPGAAHLADLRRIYRGDMPVRLDDACKARVDAAARIVAEAAQGDAAVYGNAEIRTRLGRMNLVIPTEVGVLALADVGRVFVEGEDSNEWHPGYGGGLWLGILNRQNVLTIAVAESEGRVGLYIRMGFVF